MLYENPQLLQRRPRDTNDDEALPPLLLIHDGGGTTFPYSRLGNLNRDVWGLGNPHYYSGEPWEGGMEEMARHYIHLIEKAGFRGQIVLGGWSLGGYVSILMAYLLTQGLPAPFQITGLLIIDSPYHDPGNNSKRVTPPPAPISLSPERARTSFMNALDMLSKWELPNCDECKTAADTLSFETNGKEYYLSGAHVLHFPLFAPYKVIRSRRPSASSSEASFDSSETDEKWPSQRRGTLPNAILIRCVQPMPGVQDMFRPVDRFREDETLGWANNNFSFIRAVLDIDSHHFNAFDPVKVHGTTRQIRTGLEILDSMRVEG